MTLMASYAVGFGGGLGFQPTDISSCALWLKADRGITLNGTDVSDWADQSGNGNDASQATAADQPAFVTSDSAFGGKPVVLWDVTTHVLDCAFASALTQPFESFCVFDINGVTGGDFGKVFHTPTAGDKVQFFQNGPTNQLGMSSDTDLLAGTAAEPSGPHIGHCEFDNTSSELWQGGVSQGTGTTGSLVIGTAGINIGNRDDNIRYMNGAIAELVIYDKALSTEERNALGNYLASEYSLSWTNL